jgi:RTC4-like domain
MVHCSDDLISARKEDSVVHRAPALYLTHVLVPAIILRLTMEDMEMDEQNALATMRDGSKLGMLLYEL